MNYNFIKVEQTGELAYLIINRIESRNALDQSTLNEMKHFLGTAKLDDTIGLVVITGAGEKSFAAGADINQLKEKNMLDILETGGMKEFYTYIENYEKPTIAMINGFALGGGCELALACDIRIASENAKIGFPELNLSIIPGAGGTQRLTRLIGRGKALELILTGKILSAEEAKSFGVISDVVPIDKLRESVETVAQSILSKGPLAVRLAKLSVLHGMEADINTGLIIEKLSQAILFSSQDKDEGMSAFLEKRTPNYVGK